MLHSLGYLFDDKYLNNQILQNLMIKLSDENQEIFYQLTIKIYHQLKKCHWFNLIHLLNIKNLSKINNDQQILSIPVIHLTPTRFLIMPKEKSKGHRALRSSLFNNQDDFCLVYIKPDPINIYLNINQDIYQYFNEIFQNGFKLNLNHYHLFGSSNSQIKDHSFWFIKSFSLDDIHFKRQLLGDFNQIYNIGTYVARLGLWFSKTEPTNIKLNYYLNKNQFDFNVEQGEKCVFMIDDIQRNNYCFTDGNGLISKGLAKLIQEKFLLEYLPSAYQIRLAGCKGLIIIDPQSTFQQFYIKIRPSMMKFKSDYWILDICDYSRPSNFLI